MIDFIDEIFNRKVSAEGLVLYKMLSKDEEEMQGLYRQAKLEQIHKKGIVILMKEKVEEKTILLTKIHIKGEEREIKASCIAINCEKINEQNVFRVELEFIILKAIDTKLIDNYITESLNKVFKI